MLLTEEKQQIEQLSTLLQLAQYCSQGKHLVLLRQNSSTQVVQISAERTQFQHGKSQLSQVYLSRKKPSTQEVQFSKVSQVEQLMLHCRQVAFQRQYPSVQLLQFCGDQQKLQGAQDSQLEFDRQYPRMQELQLLQQVHSSHPEAEQGTQIPTPLNVTRQQAAEQAEQSVLLVQSRQPQMQERQMLPIEASQYPEIQDQQVLLEQFEHRDYCDLHESSGRQMFCYNVYFGSHWRQVVELQVLQLQEQHWVLLGHQRQTNPVASHSRQFQIQQPTGCEGASSKQAVAKVKRQRRKIVRLFIWGI